MMRSIHTTRALDPKQTEPNSWREHFFVKPIGTLLLLGLFLAGCNSENSADTTPVEVIHEVTVADSNANENRDPATGDNAVTDTNDEDTSGNVLRHAVFFTFKEESSEEDIRGVTAAFAALPGKIDSITDLQWGVNNSPEELNDGFTHGFLLTFKDAAGRDVYLPHPAHTGEFADTLQPHMKDVFVLDYWGTPAKNELKKELKHAVFFKFKDDADPAEVKKIEQAFAALPSKIDSIKAFEWGINNSPESHDDGFTHCFMVTFDSEEGRESYLPHPDHLAFVEVLKPVLDKVRVIDFWEQ